jgi:hypothetical protein
MGFEKEVRQRVSDKGRPLTAAEFADVSAQASAHALQLLQRLLLGLDQSLRKAQGEASREVKELGKQLQSQNTASVRVYLRDQATDVAEQDRLAVNRFRDQGLPVPSKELEVSSSSSSSRRLDLSSSGTRSAICGGGQ